MLPFASGASASLIETGASYVGGQFSFTTSSVLSTLGAASGDLLITMMPGGSPGTPPALSSGNALTNTGNQYYYRVLNGADIAGTVGISGGGLACVIYRGAASVAQVVGDSASGAVTNRSIAGFTKNGAHAGLIGIAFNNSSGSSLAIGSPPTFTQRALYDPSGYIANDQCLVADRLQPVNPYYISSTAFLWSSSAGASAFRILELRS